MRSLRLLEVAAQAEALRLRCQAMGAARSAALAAVAALFGVFMLALLHLAALLWLAEDHGELRAVLYVAAADAVIAGLFLLVAKRNKYRRVADEALEIRRDSLRMVRHSSPVGEVANIVPWRGLAVGLAGRVGVGIGRKILVAFLALLFGRRRRRR
ncbi:hypothetical protein [Roseococcus thiosulfatophilus]|uniref:hypothetical protein n=1 Tax=Roseococcus thiosulfatophilus TaxID=35813 RepID=UPI001A907063|nr:hypothetical protein [Roseococcus thiosulfatophilus]